MISYICKYFRDFDIFLIWILNKFRYPLHESIILGIVICYPVFLKKNYNIRKMKRKLKQYRMDYC